MCDKAQKRRLFELAGQLRSSDPSVTIIRPGCQLLKEDDINVVNLSGNGRLREKIVLLVRKYLYLYAIILLRHAVTSAPTENILPIVLIGYWHRVEMIVISSVRMSVRPP